MTDEEVTLTTPDGECPCWVFTPGDGQAHPAVIFYMDGIGIRPTLLDMGRRLAQSGYVVLLPDLYYRAGRLPQLTGADVFGASDMMSVLGPRMAATDNKRAAADTRVFLDYLASRPDVSGTRIGTTGYCMGGAVSLTVAGTYPDRVAAAASFHGGRLVTDADTSPSRVVPDIAARVYVAGADFDAGYPQEMADNLEELLTEAGVDHRLEIYAGARHGFTMRDVPVYDEIAAERAWAELLGLLESTLSV